MDIFVLNLSKQCSKIDEYFKFLSKSEKIEAKKKKTKKLRYLYILEKAIIRSILADKIKKLPQKIKLLSDINNKYFIKNKNIHCSFSRSDNLIAVAVDKHEIGLHLTHMNEQIFFEKTPQNINIYQAKEDFYKDWTLLEACMKMKNKDFLENGNHPIYKHSERIKDYMLGITCNNDFTKDVHITEKNHNK